MTAGDTDEWLGKVSLAALQCRLLRHAWPRDQSRRSKTLPRNAGGIGWVAQGRVAGGRLLQRTMVCTGGCGTTRIERFLLSDDGRMVRDGKVSYKWTDPSYRRQRTDPDQPLEPLGDDVMRGALVHRLFPNLRW